ncbi:MAG TPA: tol-pal system protein YbgF [Gemmatimonadaceae bacterium]|nr:tol-pal system protein YbgF [Gemmatimonadaceae bacterium]
MNALVRRLTPVALVATGACFATQSDVRVLQTDMQTLRSERRQQDSVMQARFDALMASLRTTNDSVRSLSNRLTRLQGDVRGDLFQMNQQLLQIQELTGQSQRRLQELRSSLEARQQDAVQPVQPPPTPSGAPRDTGAAAAAPSGVPAGSPGPNQLFQASYGQLQRGSPESARRGFQELLRLYPASDVAGDAQYWIGVSYETEGNDAAADTAYAATVAKYPQSSSAPTALYKHALILQKRGNIAMARTALNDIIRRYPRSDEAQLARDRLRTMK